MKLYCYLAGMALLLGSAWLIGYDKRQEPLCMIAMLLGIIHLGYVSFFLGTKEKP